MASMKKDALKQRRSSAHSTLAEMLVKTFEKGQQVPVVDRETYIKLYPPTELKTKKCSGSLAPAAEQKSFPEPIFALNNNYSIPDMPLKPQNYIRYIEPSKEELDARVEYDMDEEDMAWLENVNEIRVKNGISKVSLDAFEILMDRFEKECYFEVKSLDENGKYVDSHENGILEISDDEAICCICGDGDSQQCNEILFCDMCNLAVHQECYGIPYIPEGQWLCRKCVHSPSQAVNCILCPSNAGAFKTTEGGFWSHLVCAIWVPEVQFANPVFLEPIECLLGVPPARWKLTCFICKRKGVGACVQCMQKKCGIAFHPTCAQQAGFYMKFLGRPSDSFTKTNREVFCSTHAPQDNSEDRAKLDALRSKMLKSVKTPLVFLPTLPPERIQEISYLVDFEKKNIFIPRLIAYWLLKRHKMAGVPLLPKRYNMKRREDLYPSLNNKDSPKMSSSTALQEEYKQMMRLRQDFEKVRLLLELVRKREKLKSELIKVKEGCLEAELMPLVPYLRNLVLNLLAIDKDNIFEKPVDTSVVTDYCEVITNPMDLSTMLNKVNRYEYKSFEQFEEDFHLIINNCLIFNNKNSIYYKAAISLQQKSKPLFAKVKKQLSNLNLVSKNSFGINIKTEPIEDAQEFVQVESLLNGSLGDAKNHSRKRKRNDKTFSSQKENNYSGEYSSCPDKKSRKDQNRNTLITIEKPEGLINTIKMEKDDCGCSPIVKEEVSPYSKRTRRTTTVRKESQYSL